MPSHGFGVSDVSLLKIITVLQPVKRRSDWAEFIEESSPA